MSDHQLPRPGTPEFYRERAKELLREAEMAATDGARAQLLLMADHWHRLAQSTELGTGS